MLTLHNCQEAFWMGTLKNRTLQVERRCLCSRLLLLSNENVSLLKGGGHFGCRARRSSLSRKVKRKRRMTRKVNQLDSSGKNLRASRRYL